MAVNIGLIEVPSNISSSETSVKLNNNAISSLDGRLDHITNLQRLYLISNNFVAFPILSEVGGTLERLELGKNAISEIDPALLIPLVKLTILNLYLNKLPIFPDLSSVATTLQKLSVSRNEITTIPATRLDPLVKLAYLSIYSNLLSALPDMTGPSASLTDLNAQDNPYKTVGSKEMQALNGIKVNLGKTGFIALPPVCYDKPTQLDLTGSALDLCMCDNIWLKQEEEKGYLSLYMTDITCPNATKPWTQITYVELQSMCQSIPSHCSKG